MLQVNIPPAGGVGKITIAAQTHGSPEPICRKSIVLFRIS